MDVEAMARARRREQALEALEFERGREVALREQLEETVTELEGSRIDEAAFARMAPEDVELVRPIFETGQMDDLAEEEWPGEEHSLEIDREDYEAEIARIQGEIAGSRRRQEAFERYIEALGG